MKKNFRLSCDLMAAASKFSHGKRIDKNNKLCTRASQILTDESTAWSFSIKHALSSPNRIRKKTSHGLRIEFVVYGPKRCYVFRFSSSSDRLSPRNVQCVDYRNDWMTNCNGVVQTTPFHWYPLLSLWQYGVHSGGVGNTSDLSTLQSAGYCFNLIAWVTAVPHQLLLASMSPGVRWFRPGLSRNWRSIIAIASRPITDIQCSRSPSAFGCVAY